MKTFVCKSLNYFYPLSSLISRTFNVSTIYIKNNGDSLFEEFAKNFIVTEYALSHKLSLKKNR